MAKLTKSNVTNQTAVMTTKSFEKAFGVHFTENHTGKMEGMASLSTSCICNPACIARMKDADSVCAHCYAAAMHKRYGALAAAMERNAETLSAHLFDITTLPTLNYAFFRLESFGDLINVVHARNYLRLCKRNPFVRFALWTKNPGLLRSAIELEGGKPANLRVILSSSKLNTPVDASTFEFVDATFTVWDKKTAQEKSIQINCGSKKCLGCLLCYTDSGVREINELLK